MARPKKDYVLLNMRADAGVMKRFTAYCEAVGQTKTGAFEQIVSEYLDRYDRKGKRSQKAKTEQK